MRLSDRNRRNNKARREAERLIQAEIYQQLRWIWNRLLPEWRRYARQRLQRRRITSNELVRMRKQGSINLSALWAEFRRRLDTSIRNKFRESAALMIAVEDDFWSEEEGQVDLVLDPDELVRAYDSAIERLVDGITTETRDFVGNTVTDWYQTPGSTLNDLRVNLETKFSEPRSRLIGVNEVTGLNSTIVREVMKQLDLPEWFWQTAEDDLVCVRPLEGPDGEEYLGCADLQGQVFTIEMPMPPDASHLGCRCTPVYRIQRSGAVQSHVETPLDFAAG